MKSMWVMVIVTLCLSCSNQKSVWVDDYDTALILAQKSNKKILILFTGLKWDGISEIAYEHIFQTETFKKYTNENYITVSVDIPPIAENMILDSKLLPIFEIAGRFDIIETPTLLVLSTKEEILGKITYDESIINVEVCLERLEAIEMTYLAKEKTEKKVRAFQKKIQKVSGIQKVFLIDTIYDEIDEEFHDTLIDYVRTIPEIDPNNESGLLGKYLLKLAYIDAKTLSAQGNALTATEIFKDLAENTVLSNEEKQEALYMCAYLALMDSVFPPNEIVLILQQAYNAAPKSDSAQTILSAIEQVLVLKDEK